MNYGNSNFNLTERNAEIKFQNDGAYNQKVLSMNESRKQVSDPGIEKKQVLRC